MEEDLVEYLQEVVHNSAILKCRIGRNDESDARRLLAELNISSDSIADISNKLKNNSKVTLSELRTLKNGLMDNAKNAEIFLNTDGALTRLVQILSGKNKSKQLLAAGCCCNLSLGVGEGVGVGVGVGVGEEAVAGAAGPQLVAGLASLRREYAATCAWTVGNLCMGGVKSWEILVAQGALEKLCEMLYSRDEFVWDAVVYALVRLTRQMGDRLSLEYLNKILEGLWYHFHLTTESSQLTFILSCHKDFLKSFAFVEEQRYSGLYFMIISEIRIYIDYHVRYCKQRKWRKVCIGEFLLRILANGEPTWHGYTINELLLHASYITFERLLDKEDVVSETLMWVLGNLLNDCVSGDLLFDYRLMMNNRR